MVNNKIFGNQEISSMEILDEFLNRFDFQKRKYKVYIALNKKAKQFKDILESRLGANLETDYFSEKLKINSDEYIHVGFEIEALDENKAAQEVYENVNLFIRFYKFLGNRREEWFLNVW